MQYTPFATGKIGQLVNFVRCGVPLSKGELGHMMWGEVGLSQFTSYSICHFPQNFQLLYAVLIGLNIIKITGTFVSH